MSFLSLFEIYLVIVFDFSFFLYIMINCDVKADKKTFYTFFSFTRFVHDNWNLKYFIVERVIILLDFKAYKFLFFSKNMGNEQQGGTSHHFIANSSNQEYQTQKRNSFLLTKNGRVYRSIETIIKI